MKKIIFFIFIIFVFLPCSIYAEQRVESIQWYSDSGEEDAYELKLFNDKDAIISSITKLNNNIIDSSFMIYSKNKVCTYDISGELVSIEERNKHRRIITYFSNHSPSFQTIFVFLSKYHIQYTTYRLPEDVIDEMYEEIIAKDNSRIRNWLDPATQTTVKSEKIIEKYDNNGLLIYQEKRDANSGQFLSKVRSYRYNVKRDEQNRIISVEAFSAVDNREVMIYRKEIKYGQ